ncbi:MAG: hypothetical protein Q9M31_06970 [Mariprofundus sp.]|nr:hypothetical protein [Mariprofundus sp.]
MTNPTPFPLLKKLHEKEFLHDLGNIICVISGRVQMLEKLLVDNAIQDDAIMKHQINCLSKAVNQMATFYKHPDANSPTAERVNLKEVVHDCCDMVSPLLSDHIAFSLKMVGNIQCHESDKLPLTKILLNLMKDGLGQLKGDNEVLSISIGRTWLTHADIENSICSEARASGPYVYLQVSNQGHALDTLPMIDKAPDQQRGYGLRSVMRTINDLEGLLQVDHSVNPGTTVRALFPCEQVYGVFLMCKNISAADNNKKVNQLIEQISRRTRNQLKEPNLHPELKE